MEKATKEGRAPKPKKTLKARDLWDQIAFAAWSCADPGVQFDTTINEWHTCPADGRINATQPVRHRRHARRHVRRAASASTELLDEPFAGRRRRRAGSTPIEPAFQTGDEAGLPAAHQGRATS